MVNQKKRPKELHDEAPEEMLTPKVVAVRLNISVSNVYLLIKQGRLQANKLSRRAIRIPARSVSQLLKETTTIKSD